VSLDFGAGENRMKELTKYQRFLKRESEIYLFSFISMYTQNFIKISDLDEEKEKITIEDLQEFINGT
jgi:hypothetical protein